MDIVLLARSALFTLFMGLSITLFAIPMALTLGLPPLERFRFAVGRACASVELKALSWFCGLNYQVTGLSHLPKIGGILFWRHESTWETFLSFLLPEKPTWVLKRELLWIPIVGWAIAALKPIAINRSAGRRAVNQVLRRGRDQLEQGRTLNFFPEGTRLSPGERRRYGVSGALLANESGQPVIPIAHNAGDFWPRRSLLKHPGTIQVHIGPAIDGRGLTPEELNRQVSEWIEGELARIRS
jgi:1-acyl-sn-glycerol-3-phosphate acyltransferase